MRQALDPAGLVFVHGELWSAVSDGEPIQAGEGVVVERLEGFTLHVQPAPMEEVPSVTEVIAGIIVIVLIVALLAPP